MSPAEIDDGASTNRMMNTFSSFVNDKIQMNSINVENIQISPGEMKHRNSELFDHVTNWHFLTFRVSNWQPQKRLNHNIMSNRQPPEPSSICKVGSSGFDFQTRNNLKQGVGHCYPQQLAASLTKMSPSLQSLSS